MDKVLVGRVLKLFISTSGDEKRVPKDMIKLDDGGVVGDKFNGKNILRSILLTSLQSYTKSADNNIELNQGDLGENILMDFNPYTLPFGTKIQIGNAVVELSQGPTLCAGLSKINNKLPKLLKNDRGIFAKTIAQGDVFVGDAIYIFKV